MSRQNSSPPGELATRLLDGWRLLPTPPTLNPQLSTLNSSFVAGVDEAGRGCLAGPVVAAAVILPPLCRIPGVHDSKRLSPRQREAVLPRILEAALSWATGHADVEEIDRANILQATYLAMHRALEKLNPAPDFVLVDGWPIPGLQIPQRGVLKGDSTLLPIAAASIIAKVTRDRHMADLASQFREYHLAHNKGYATPAHLQALRNHGPSAAHRLSFRPVARAMILPLPFSDQRG